jgi:predicted AAA+ superfamily ATPase
MEARCIKALGAMPVVVVTGMRQSGKTTLVRDLAPGRGRAFRSFDDFGVLAQAKENPESLFADAPVTFDEAQRVPEIFLSIKKSVDSFRKNGLFLLTGSTNILLLKSVSDSLAGRAVYLELMPFCPSEFVSDNSMPGLIDRIFEPDFSFRDWPGSVPNWQSWLFRGGFYSSVTAASSQDRDFWFTGYVQAYLERDLRHISQIDQLPDFQKVMRFAALRTGRLINQSEIARDAAIPQPTCHRYLNLLEAGYQISRLPVYAVNRTKSLIKAKKLFWNDCGLAAWLASLRSPDEIVKRPDMGFWFEQALFQTFHAWVAMDPIRRKAYYWRNNKGQEVDLILEQDDRIVACEIKASSTVMPIDAKNLNVFAGSLGKYRERLVRSIVFYGGATNRTLGENCTALSTGCFFPDDNRAAS